MSPQQTIIRSIIILPTLIPRNASIYVIAIQRRSEINIEKVSQRCLEYKIRYIPRYASIFCFMVIRARLLACDMFDLGGWGVVTTVAVDTALISSSLLPAGDLLSVEFVFSFTLGKVCALSSSSFMVSTALPLLLGEGDILRPRYTEKSVWLFWDKNSNRRG